MAVNLEYYRVFYYVARYRNMTKAAAALMSNQPNVTRVMNLLENELGCRLVNRSNRGITLTAEGERLYGHIAEAFEQIRMGEDELGQVLKLKKGVVFIGASVTALHGYLLEKLGIFHAKHPDIQLKISNHTTPEALNALKGRKIDLAVVTSPIEAGSAYQMTRLRPYRDVLAGGRQFMHLAQTGISLQKLLQYPLISLGQNTGTYEFYRQLFLKHGLVMEPDIEVAATDLILPMISNNLGLGFLPRTFVEEAIEKGEVVEIPLKEQIPDRYICLVTDPQRNLSVAALELMQLLQKD